MLGFFLGRSLPVIRGSVVINADLAKLLEAGPRHAFELLFLVMNYLKLLKIIYTKLMLSNFQIILSSDVISMLSFLNFI